MGIEYGAVNRIALDLLGDTIHRGDGFDRVLSGRGFRREHDRIRSLEDRGRDIRHLGSGGHRAADHGFQHLGCYHHRLAGPTRGAGHQLLHAGHFFQRHFHAEIAACDHERIGNFDDLAQAMHRLGLFDLGHHRRPAASDFLGLRNVFGPLDEGERNPVDPGVKRRFEVGAVLLHEGRERNDSIGQAHALAIGELSADFHPRDDALSFDLDGDEPNFSVVEQERVAGLDRSKDLGVRQVYACGIPRTGIAVEHKCLALDQGCRTVGKAANPQLGPLQIDQDANGPSVLGLNRADRRDELAHALMRRVTHVDAKHVGTGRKQVRDDALAGGGRSESGYDFGPAQTSHQLRLRDAGAGMPGLPAPAGVCIMGTRDCRACIGT